MREITIEANVRGHKVSVDETLGVIQVYLDLLAEEGLRGYEMVSRQLRVRMQ